MYALLQEDTVAVKVVIGYQQNYQNNFQQQHQYQNPPRFQQQQNFQSSGFQHPIYHKLNQQNYQQQKFKNHPSNQRASSSNMAL